MIDIRGYDKTEVLMALYNKAKTQGKGILHFDPEPMTLDEAQRLIDKNPSLYFDYVKGRIMKVDLRGNEVDTLLYNRDNGPGAAEDAWLDYLTAPKSSDLRNPAYDGPMGVFEGYGDYDK